MLDAEEVLVAALDSLAAPWLAWGPDGRVAAASPRLLAALRLDGRQIVALDERTLAAAVAGQGGVLEPSSLRAAGGAVLQRRPTTLGNGGRLELFVDGGGEKAAAQRREELLGVAIHDLRAPLANVRSYAGLLLSGRFPDVDPRVRRSAEVIARNADKALRMLQTWFDAQRADTGELELDLQPVSLSALVEEQLAARRASAGEKGVALTFAGASGAGARPVPLDKDRVAVAVGGLLDAAIARSPADATVEVGVTGRAGEVQVSVADRGPALAAEEQRCAFDRDAQALAERKLGPGFARAVGGAIARAHGGTAGVTSTAERSVFWLGFPA